MARDSSIALRKAIITHLRADPDLVELVPVSRQFGLRVSVPDPKKPFTKYGVPTKLPERASGMDGARIVGSIHAFSDADSEDEVGAIGAAVAKVLDGPGGKGLVLELIAPFAATATVTYTGGQTLQDPEEEGSWHEVVNFEAVVVS